MRALEPAGRDVPPIIRTGRAHPESGSRPQVEVRNLRLEVDGAPLIDGLNFQLLPDGLTAIMGPNGAGKSLLLRLMHGLLEPTGGQVLWGGAPVDERIRRRQAMVFQKPVLLRRSVAANIDFVLGLRGRADRHRRDAILSHIKLADRARQPARLLSGGEQQRLALARALAIEPEVLFLDEPTSNLDPASVVEIERLLRDARDAGTKIVLVTHDAGQARRLAEEVVFLVRGQVGEQGAAESFFAAPRTAAARAYLEGKIVL